MSSFHAGFEPGQPPVKVRIARGARHEVGAEIDALGCSRALVLTTPEQAGVGAALVTELGAKAVGHFSGAVMHTPYAVTEAALVEARAADCLVAIGGGSTIGLAKALALRTGLPQIVLPTTYAGSEATPVLGQTRDGAKETLRSPDVQPEVVLYDPELVATLPAPLTVTSGLNAMAHAFEALYARDANPLSDQLALAGIAAFVSGLPRVVAAPDDLKAREATQFGSWLCGTVLAQVGMALHHKLCHTLGGSLNLPHAETHAILLPHTVAYNEAAVPEALAPAAAILGAPAAGAGLHALARRLGAPLALRDLSVAVGDLDRVVSRAVENPYWNPRPVTAEGLRALLLRAWEGCAPEA